MDQTNISVLILDDEESMLDALNKGFQRSKNFRFEITCVHSIQHLFDHKALDSHYYVNIIDLNLPEGARAGRRVIAEINHLHPGSLIYAYSAHNDSSSIVKCIGAGATDFIHKAECPPHELVAYIEKCCTSSLEREERMRQQRNNDPETTNDFYTEHAGKVVAVVGYDVIAHGTTRLQALVRYDDIRRHNTALPEEPDLYKIPESRNG